MIHLCHDSHYSYMHSWFHLSFLHLNSTRSTNWKYFFFSREKAQEKFQVSRFPRTHSIEINLAANSQWHQNGWINSCRDKCHQTTYECERRSCNALTKFGTEWFSNEKDTWREFHCDAVDHTEWLCQMYNPHNSDVAIICVFFFIAHFPNGKYHENVLVVGIVAGRSILTVIHSVNFTHKNTHKKMVHAVACLVAIRLHSLQRCAYHFRHFSGTHSLPQCFDNNAGSHR